MLKHRLYFSLKPYLPWRLRMGLRRILARRKYKACRETWPIDESAGRMPAGWPGWPDGKKFAFVLTHDVEGPEGLARCQQVAELEQELGFRSSFNFIPEGAYDVPQDLRAWLVARGFEVGVHDLEHDGRLFQSKRGFEKKAERINHYLRDWDAVGFRAGFMLRHLGWLHGLDVLYDSTTFDTDPFEPQPNGANTIFPAWLGAPAGGRPGAEKTAQSRGGYVELPYTLAQDSTLFLVLEETSPEIWLRKLDWIVGHGGMALVNVHPDYMALPGTQVTRKQYPAAHYTEFLRHVSGKYAGQFWNPVPRELAGWFKQNRSESSETITVGRDVERRTPTAVGQNGSPLRGKRTAVLLYSTYPSDPRPRRAAEALIDAGMEVDLFCLSEKETDSRFERVNGVQVFRLPMQRRRASKRTYLWQYSRFLASSFWFLVRKGLWRKYDLVHVHNMPDVLVFSALVPKLLGAKIILDLHDPMPELMMTIFGARENSAQIRLLKRLERWSIGFADAVLTVNEACKRIFSNRSCPPAKVNVVMNSPDESIFAFRELSASRPVPRVNGARFTIMYHGSLVERHGLDLAVTALGSIRKSIPGAELWVYGQSTPFLQKVMASVQNSDLREAVRYHGPKNLEDIVAAIGQCDVGVIPNRRSVFTEINTPTRIFEYLSRGKPVVAPRVPGILDYFGPEDLVYFELGDAGDLAAKLEYVYQQPDAVAATVRRGQGVYRSHCWSNERKKFTDLTARILNGDGRLAADVPGTTNDGGHRTK